MSARLNELTADQRFELLREWLRVGLALLGDGQPSRVADHFPDVREMVGVGQSENPMAASLERHMAKVEEDRKLRGNRKFQPNKISHQMRQRMFGMFAEGLTAREAHRKLVEELGTLPFSFGAVSWWKWKWSHQEPVTPDHPVQEPTRSGQPCLEPT